MKVVIIDLYTAMMLLRNNEYTDSVKYVLIFGITAVEDLEGGDLVVTMVALEAKAVLVEGKCSYLNTEYIFNN